MSSSSIAAAASTRRQGAELVAVAGAAVLSQAVPEPARFLIDHQGLDVALALLVLTTAVTLSPSTFRGLTAHTGRLVLAILGCAVGLPGLAWAVSHLVSNPALRRGVLSLGLAPAEIASVATTSLAAGDAAVAAGILIASTVVTAFGAGFGLRLLGAGGHVGTLSLLGSLGLVVLAPLVAGVGFRSRVQLAAHHEAVAQRLSLALVILLVWLIASQVHLSRSYLAVAAALVAFVAGSALLGAGFALGAPPGFARAIVLTTSMRDFAIAAAIAVAAFGSASAAPLGLYGVLVIGWGVALATIRPRPAADQAKSGS